MKLAVLFSGGKDSCLAMHYAMKYHKIACLISIISESEESYMFHVPNIELTKLQAKMMNIPIIIQKTVGEKEKELKDLEKAIKLAITKYHVEGVVTGAVESAYQASRVQKICSKLKIECFNPLWQKDQMGILQELIEKKFEILIVGTFAEGLNDILGRTIDERFISDMKRLSDKYKINPAGEGGEYESFALNAPFFKKRIEILKSEILQETSGGRVLKILQTQE
ncbi:MAG: diphthine--ammonia ligase [Candidatus Woesearchaeota archaeon]